MKITDTSQFIVFNHFYKLRHDEKRSIIYSTEKENIISTVQINESWVSKIHPVYAMIFSFLSEPITVADLFEEIAYFLDISEEKAQEIITPILEQGEAFYIEYEGVNNYFPMNIVIPASEAFAKIRIYSPLDFRYDEVDIEQERYYVAPFTSVLMLNNKCVTNYAYCYADTTTSNQEMPFERLKEVIKNAYELGIMSISLSGGEVFLYKKLPELLEVMKQYDYPAGLLSTKVPLTEEKILSVKPYSPTIQLSLDAIEDPILSKMLKVKEGYAEKVKKRYSSTGKTQYDVSDSYCINSL